MEIADCIVCLFRSKLLSIFRDQLIADCSRRHIHLILVGFCLLQSIFVPVNVYMINGVLGSFSRKLIAIFGCELIINASFRLSLLQIEILWGYFHPLP